MIHDRPTQSEVGHNFELEAKLLFLVNNNLKSLPCFTNPKQYLLKTDFGPIKIFSFILGFISTSFMGLLLALFDAKVHQTESDWMESIVF